MKIQTMKQRTLKARKVLSGLSGRLARISLVTVLLSSTAFTSSVNAKEPSFSKGVATTTHSELIECGNRSRISAVGEITSEDGKKWIVPAETHFLTAKKASDLYNGCGGNELNSSTDIDLSKVTIVDVSGGATDTEVFTGYIFPDNYFELYINGELIAVDPVPFTPFNSSVVRFKASYPFTISVKMVDWEETLGLGLEGNRGTRYHAGDGGFVAHFQDSTGKTVALTDNSWKAQTFYTAPIVDRKCLVVRGSKRDSSACNTQQVSRFETTSAAHWMIPKNWIKADFDDSAWPAATTFTNDIVGVDNKRSYTNFTDLFDTQGADATFIWSSNLVLDNLVLLRKTVNKPNKIVSALVPKKKKRKLKKRKPKKPRITLKVPSQSESIASEACSRIQASVAKSGEKGVVVTCDDTYAYVQSDTYPDHSLMNGITGTNEQLPVPALNYAAPILLKPEIIKTKTSIDAALGVAINGVPIYDYSAQGEIDLHGYDKTKDTVVLGQLDECGGHAGRGDDYHYHAKPTCMIDSMKKVSDATIIGWGYDGFPLYGDANPDGSAISKGDLDVCNGQSDSQFGYRYHTSVEAPYIIQCLVGKVDRSILPRVSPLKGADARADLRPPRDGVENLKHVRTDDGTRTLTYSYKGDAYYTQFKPSENKTNCYDFEQKTISNNGKVESGTYCR